MHAVTLPVKLSRNRSSGALADAASPCALLSCFDRDKRLGLTLGVAAGALSVPPLSRGKYEPVRFLHHPLASSDPDLAKAIELELGRQRHEIELIAPRTSFRAPCWRPGSFSPTNMPKAIRASAITSAICRYRENLAMIARSSCWLRLRQCAAQFRHQANQSVFLALARLATPSWPRSRRRRHLTHGSRR